ncbi:MAG: RNA ligase [Desulfuromonadaceae bacterium]
MSTRNESLYQEYLKNQDLVTLKPTSNPDLFVLKYKRKVFFGKDLWNDFLRECRGLIVDKDWNIVSLPFTKIHNYGIEKDAPSFSDDEEVFASRKVNGFMIAVTWYNDDLLWSTTGSIDSDFVGYAKEIFESWSDQEREVFRKKIAENDNRTFMFECVHPQDPHIVEEETGLYFIGLREKSFSAKPFLAIKNVEEVYWGETGVRVDDTYYVNKGTDDAKSY